MERNNTIPFAQSVNDQMSFNEAFAAARHEVGPGGAFVWHGTIYGTYYGSEWNALSPSEQHAFTSDAVYTYHHQEDINVGPKESPEIQKPQEQEQPKVHVVMVDEDYAIDEETHVGLGVVEINGIEVVFIDIDQDGVFDISMADLNGNGVIDDDEMQPEDSGLTVSDLEAIAQEETQENGNVPAGVDVVAVIKDVEITEDGDHGNVGIAMVDGVETLLFDTDMNGTFDVAMGDFNGDGQISDEEVVLVDNPQLTVQSFEQQIQNRDGVDNEGNLLTYEDTPDYTNSTEIADSNGHLA